MHLKLLKLSGFKSFVDPTVIPFPSQLNAIVGPNGCGKSNIVDAIRWVIGETSAKQLRGQSMADVIFNGTSGRKPVGKASVELVFDNSDGGIKGEFAQYSEISVRREVHLEGQSQYFLNGTGCRRRDIIDIFLGTGLGPRSYAIIEQGMISQLIEAKPEELRVHLEEVAGISKYKERRRETGNRIRHTEENLDRLNDVLEELEKQLKHLKRQANAAERYKDLKQQERVLQAQIKALQWQGLATTLEQQDQAIEQQQLLAEEQLASLRQVETEQARLREQQVEWQQQRDQVQEHFYSLGADIARSEQRINHLQQQTVQWQGELEDVSQLWQECQDNMHEYEQQQQDLSDEILQLQPASAEARESSAESAEVLANAEQSMQAWQQRWDEFQSKAHQAAQQNEVAKTKETHHQQQVQRLCTRQQDLQQRLSQLNLDQISEEINPLQTQAQQLETNLSQLQLELEDTRDNIQSQRDSNEAHKQQFNTHQHQLQQQQQQFASLQALQQAALGQQDDDVNEWLQDQDLQQSPRLGQQLNVKPGWEVAVETVLSGYFDAVCVDGSIKQQVSQASHLASGHMTLLEVGDNSISEVADQSELTPLSSQVDSDWPLYDWLKGIYIANDLTHAQQIQSRLKTGESVITQDGIWLGQHWLRISKEQDQENGVLAREQQLRDLTQQIEQRQQQCDQARQSLQQGEQQLSELEQQRDQLHQQLQQYNRELTQVQSTLSAAQSKHQALQQQQQRLSSELTDCEQQLANTEDELLQIQQQLQVSSTHQDEFAIEQQQLLSKRDQCRQQLEQARQQAEQQRRQADELVVRVSTNENQLAMVKQMLQRDQRQLEQLTARRDALTENLSGNDSPIETLQQELQVYLDKRVTVEQELKQAEQLLTDCNQQLEQHNKQWQQLNSAIDEYKQAVQQLQMQRQETHVRQSTIQEQLQESDMVLENLLAALPEEANTEEWERQAEQIAARITRLGAINLAAIDEYQTVNERKTYLDKQQADLVEALEILTNAIRKIDRETRSKFRETYEAVNLGFQKLFPAVFGGGRAELILEDEDILTAGVLVKAQPPGKRNASVHMLSGGEKALTAIALVFAMFELNPAPFCILDEVDAPLDDMNVGRFCQLVKEMSQQTQFIVVSHNKVTISEAQHLMGITQQEKGVSRTVSVDMQEAVAMAE